MKKSILVLATSTLITGAFLTSCNSPAEKMENAQNNVIEANKDLDKASDEYLADFDKYKKEADEKIAANDKSIADFKTRIENKKKEAKVDYKNKIAELEQKNSDMKKKIDDYKVEGKEKWEMFKKDFSKGMDEIGNALKDLTSSKTK